MKCLMTLDVKIDLSLRVKRRIIVFNDHRSKASPDEQVKQEKQASSNYVTIQEVDDLNSEIKLTETPKTL